MSTAATANKSVLERFVGEIRQIEHCLGEESCPKQLAFLIEKTAVSSSSIVPETTGEPGELKCGKDWRDQLLHIQKRKIRELDCFLKIVVHKLGPRTTPLQEEYEKKVDMERENLIRLIGHQQ
jgi:hypothetical protein